MTVRTSFNKQARAVTPCGTPKRRVRFSDKLECVRLIKPLIGYKLWSKEEDRSDIDRIGAMRANEKNGNRKLRKYLSTYDRAYQQLHRNGAVDDADYASLVSLLVKSDYRVVERLSPASLVRYDGRRAERSSVVRMSRNLQSLIADDVGGLGGVGIDEWDVPAWTARECWDAVAEFSREQSAFAQTWANFKAKMDADVASLVMQAPFEKTIEPPKMEPLAVRIEQSDSKPLQMIQPQAVALAH